MDWIGQIHKILHTDNGFGYLSVTLGFDFQMDLPQLRNELVDILNS